MYGYQNSIKLSKDNNVKDEKEVSPKKTIGWFIGNTWWEGLY